MRSSHKFTTVLECALWCISQSDTVCTLSCRDDISLSFFSKDFVLKEAMLPEHRHAPPSTHVHCELPLWSYGDCSSWTRVSRDIFTQSWMKWKKWKTALFKSSQKNIKENESKINVLNATFISLQEYSKQRCQYEQPPGRLETLTLSMVFFLMYLDAGQLATRTISMWERLAYGTFSDFAYVYCMKVYELCVKMCFNCSWAKPISVNMRFEHF